MPLSSSGIEETEASSFHFGKDHCHQPRPGREKKKKKIRGSSLEGRAGQLCISENVENRKRKKGVPVAEGCLRVKLGTIVQNRSGL